MNLRAYHTAIMQGFSERESEKIGEDAWEDEMLSRRNEQRQPDEAPACDICANNIAVTGANGYGVCSEKCANAAALRSKA